jgi:hypothetical protein
VGQRGVARGARPTAYAQPRAARPSSRARRAEPAPAAERRHRGIVTLDDLSRMKPTSLFVNTSRAELVEENALVSR